MSLKYDAASQRWSLRIGDRFYTWEGDPFDRAAAERVAWQIVLLPR